MVEELVSAVSESTTQQADVTESTIPSSTVFLHSDDSLTVPTYHPSMDSFCHSSTDNTDNSSAVDLSYTSTVPSPATKVKKTKMKSVSVSVHVKTKDKGTKLTCDTLSLCSFMIATQADSRPQQISVGTQCNLIDAPPLQRLPQVTSLDDSFVIETETEETDMDTSFLSNQEDYTTE